MTATNDQTPAADTTWNHSTPVVFSPLFAWPPKPRAALLTLTQRWFTVSRSILFLAMAVLVHQYLLPVSDQMKSLTGSWVALVFLSNFLFMLIIAGSLHLFLFTFRMQGKQLKYDHRESHEISRKFTFRSQVRDNMFWSLVSGSAIWSIYEMFYFHGVARGAIPTVTLAQQPVAFVLWLLAMPIITSSHFYAIHRLLHWPPLYRSVHRLHHRNIHIGPWSGMSMHPVEHIFYISSVLIHFVVPSHPVIFLMHIYGRCLGPAFSHSGFEKLIIGNSPLLDSADFHHQLHHRYFECNYGTAETPWDQWFGTDHDGSAAATERVRAKIRARAMQEQT